MRHKKHMVLYIILVLAILYVGYQILMAKQAPGSLSTTGTSGTGTSLGTPTTSDLRQGIPQGSRNSLYSAFTRRRLGVTAF